MIYFALLSGLISFCSQAAFLRVISAVNGDYYLTFFLVTLTYIAGSAIGNVAGRHFRRLLPWVELFAGGYTVLVATALTHDWLRPGGVDLVQAVSLVLPAAIALGLHVPLYSLFASDRVGRTYGVYHINAACALMLLEWFVLPSARLSQVLLVFGGSQLLLGCVLMAAFFLKRRDFSALIKAQPVSFSIAAPHALAVFLSSVASFFSMTWGLRLYEYLLLPTRMHLGLFNAANVLMMACGSLLIAKIQRQGALIASCIVAICGCCSIVLFSFAPTLLANAEFWRVEVYAIALAMLLCSATFGSAAVFATCCDLAQGARDVVSGRLLFLSAVGCVLGGGLSFSLESYALVSWPFAVAISLVSATLLFTALRSSCVWLLATGGGIVCLCSIWLMSTAFTPLESIFLTRYGSFSLKSSSMLSLHGSMAGYVYGERTIDNEKAPALSYFVDGHDSHDVLGPSEVVVGMLSSIFLKEPFHHSLVIGMGSGQSVLGVSAISVQTDVVEISDAVRGAITKFSRYNNNVLLGHNVIIHKQDGLDFVSRCRPGSYDYIFNTSTYPVMFNAYKLYTDEFVKAASQCLARTGVFQSYFDDSSVLTLQDASRMLEPIRRHFKYVYIVPHPYPNVIASNYPLAPKSSVDLNGLVRRATDREFLSGDVLFLHELRCAGWVNSQAVFPGRSTDLSTLDFPSIENHAVKLRLYGLTHGEKSRSSPVSRILSMFDPNMSPDDGGSQCKVFNMDDDRKDGFIFSPVILTSLRLVPPLPATILNQNPPFRIETSGAAIMMPDMSPVIPIEPPARGRSAPVLQSGVTGQREDPLVNLYRSGE